MEKKTIQPITDGNFTMVNFDVISITDSECAIILGYIHFWIQTKENNCEETYRHDGRYWTYNSVKKWHEAMPCFSEDLIKRKLKKLRDMGILIVGNFNKMRGDRTLWYTIDYDRINKLIADHWGKIHQCIGGKSSNALVENPPTNTYINNNIINNNLNVNGASSGAASDTLDDNVALAPQGMPTRAPQGDVDSIIKRQVSRYFEGYRENDDTKDEVIRIVNYFYRKYQEVFGCPHPIMTQNTMDNVVASIISGTDLVKDVDFEIYRGLIDSYFELDMPNCDYHITHFVSGHVRDYRWYDCGFGGLLEEYRYGT